VAKQGPGETDLHQGNRYVLIMGLPRPEAPLTLAPGLTLLPLEIAFVGIRPGRCWSRWLSRVGDVGVRLASMYVRDRDGQRLRCCTRLRHPPLEVGDDERVAAPGDKSLTSTRNSNSRFVGRWLQAPATTDIEGRPGAGSRVRFPLMHAPKELVTHIGERSSLENNLVLLAHEAERRQTRERQRQIPRTRPVASAARSRDR